MERIKRFSLFFRIIFQIVFCAIPIITVIAWMTSPENFVSLHGMFHMNFIPRPYANTILHTLTTQEKILGLFISMIPVVIVLYILLMLIKLFKLYEKGEIFSINNVIYIRHIAYAMVVTQIVNPFYEALMGILLTMNNPPGYRYFAITFDQTNLGIISTACIIILISWVMAEGCKLREEQQLTI